MELAKRDRLRVEELHGRPQRYLDEAHARRCALAPLHLRSDRSFGFGTASPLEIVERLVTEGVTAAALTDVEGLHAPVAFQVLSLDAGIRPVVGVELRERDPGATGSRGRATGATRVVLLARDRAGYERICRIVTLRREAVVLGSGVHVRGAEGIVGALEAVGAEGLFVLTDDPDLARVLATRACVPREALRLLLVRPRPEWPEERLRAAAEAIGAPLVADPDAVFLEPEDHALHRLLSAISERREAAGTDLEEADELRRTLVDLQHDREGLARLEQEFLMRSERRGVRPRDAADTWTELARLAAYSFNEAHASSYALLAYRSAFLRCHAPVAFACGVLDHHGGAYPMRTIAAEIGRWGVRVLAPHVSSSFADTVPQDGGVRLGLARVKGLARVRCDGS